LQFSVVFLDGGYMSESLAVLCLVGLVLGTLGVSSVCCFAILAGCYVKLRVEQRAGELTIDPSAGDGESSNRKPRHGRAK
jgi:hypothetical protein